MSLLLYLPVDILFNIARHIKVDHMLDTWNIQTSGSDSSGNNYRSLSGLEPSNR